MQSNDGDTRSNGGRELSRRRFVAGGLGVAGALGLSGVLAACGSNPGSTATGNAGAAAAGTGNIDLLGWSYFNAPELDAAGVTATWTPLALATDLYTRTRQPGTFDVAMPGSFQLATMGDLGLVEPLDESRLPNLANVDPDLDLAWARRDGKLYAVPVDLYWSYAVWDKAQTAPVSTFEDLFRPELKGKVGIMDEPVTLFVLAGLLPDYNGQALTEQQLGEVEGMLQRLRPQIGSLYPFGSAPDLFGRREVAVTIHSLPPEVGNVRKAGIDAGAGFYGSYAAMDAWSIITGAKNPDAAYIYMNNSLTPVAQAAMTASTGTSPAVRGVQDQPADVVEFGGVANILQNSNFLEPIPTEGADGVVGNSEMSAAWTRFKESL